MTKRKAIPEAIQANVIHKSASRCVICYGTRKFTDSVYPSPGFQIAHIDQDASNSQEDNLALLCVPCHSMYDSTFRQTKNYRPENLRQWRHQLYEDVKVNRLPPPMIYLHGGMLTSQATQPVADPNISTLRDFLGKAGFIAERLCKDGTYLSIAIERNRLQYIEKHFSYWRTNPLRSRRREVAALQDEFISILMEIVRSYEYLGTLDDVPSHIIPMGYFNDLGHAIKVPEHYCCGELFNVIEVRDKWILAMLIRLRDLFIRLDDMAMD